jgi:hypothetical protein
MPDDHKEKIILRTESDIIWLIDSLKKDNKVFTILP